VLYDRYGGIAISYGGDLKKTLLCMVRYLTIS